MDGAESAELNGGGMRVLVVDDDEELRLRVRGFLSMHGIDADEASTGETALAALSVRHFDAVLLDVMMPGMDGLDVIRKLRSQSDVAVLMLTGKDSEADQVVGLELGADDYIVKPFKPRELLARLRAVVRRSSSRSRNRRIEAAGIDLDLSSRTVSRDGRVLELTGIEFDILTALMRSRGVVIPRERLLAEAGRNNLTVTERTVDVHVSRLRKKLEDDPQSPRFIKTVHCVGYVFAG